MRRDAAQSDAVLEKFRVTEYPRTRLEGLLALSDAFTREDRPGAALASARVARDIALASPAALKSEFGPASSAALARTALKAEEFLRSLSGSPDERAEAANGVMNLPGGPPADVRARATLAYLDEARDLWARADKRADPVEKKRYEEAAASWASAAWPDHAQDLADPRVSVALAEGETTLLLEKARAWLRSLRP